MKRLVLSLLGLAAAAACSGSTPTEPTTFNVPLVASQPKLGGPLSSTHLTGDHENPPNASLAQGQALLTVADDRLSVSYKLIASNIENVVQAHIHIGSPSVNGPVVVFLYGVAPSGGGRHDGVLSEGTFTAANLVGPLAGQPLSALLAQIVAGNAYVNVHTNDGVAPMNTGPGDLAGGEVRGQIRAKRSGSQ